MEHNITSFHLQRLDFKRLK